MSFGGSPKIPAAAQKPLGADAYRASTSEQARAVPYLAGEQRIALTFISDVFDTKVDGVSSGGKGGGKTGNNFYASFAALACFGPVRALHAIYLNGDPVYTSETVVKITSLTFSSVTGLATATTKNAHGLTTGDVVVISGAEQAEYNGEFPVTVTGPTTFTVDVPGTPATPATGTKSFRVRLDPVFRDGGHPNFVDVTIPDYGVMRLYWGTETQLQDSYLLSSGIEHPAYRGFCYAVFHRLFLGFNQTNVQNIELVLSFYPTQTWLEERNIEDDVNPVSFIADVLQNPRAGCALSDERVDQDGMLATADELDDIEFGISPLITRSQESREAINNALQYFDGYPLPSADGKLNIKRFKKPVGELPEVTDADLTARPQFTPDDWSSVATETSVRFTNREFGFKEDLSKYRDAGAFNIVGEPNQLELDRPWITRSELAQSHANAVGRASAVPKITGKLSLRWNSGLFDDLIPGAAFRINHSARNTTGLIFRVIERTLPEPNQPSFEIQFESDRTHLYEIDEVVTPEQTGHRLSLPKEEPSLSAVSLRVVELPAGLSADFKPTLGVLVARNEETNHGFSIYQNKDYGGAPDSYELRAAGEAFARHGILTEVYPIETQTIDLLQGIVAQLDGIDITLDAQTDFDALADALLVFVGDEVLSVNKVELLSSGLYRLFVTRERFGSARQAHETASEVFIIRRSDLLRLNHPSFQPGNELTFKIALQNGAGETELGNIDPVSLTLSGKLFEQPKLSNMRINGSADAPTYSAGDDIVIDWSMTFAEGTFLLPDRYTVKTRVDFLKEADFPPTPVEIETPDELTLVGSQSVEGNSLTVENADLVTMLGGETDFIAIVRREVEGPDFKKVSEPQLLLVTKI